MKRILVFAAVILFLASCKKETSLESSVQPELSAKEYAKMTEDALLAKSKDSKNEKSKGDKDKDKDRDDERGKGKDKLETKVLKSSGSGTIAYTPGGCGAGTVRFNSNGTGNSTVIGFFSQQITFCMDMNTGQVISPITGVGTTPKGDKIYYSFASQGIDLATGFTYQDFIITGGTGKYEGASGATRLLYDINEPNAYRYTGTGTITF
ncbi:hypothetical protein [Daejeonella sp.]|uniref:hypothetical protein n=1 Tax=Daejeonella sp. TaxID=2805397 RepID=UPI002716415C|nr:hypothetical protein [Daejeonella sp.]MDO8991760.1 hypothetical protein [Daejeonella sp.]MDP2413556.1 hypothetical protein [Daejeonella sp.]